MSEVERPQRKPLPRGLLTIVVVAIVAISIMTVAAVNAFRDDTLPPNELVSVVTSDSPSVDVVTIRSTPHQGRWSQNQNDNTMTTVPSGTEVTIRCIAKDVEGSGNWYYVTVRNGPVPGISGYVWGLLIRDAPRVPACGAINLDVYPPLPGTVTLSQGPKAQAGYWYRITLRRLAPNATLSVDCFDDSESAAGPVVNPTPFRTFAIRTDGAGNAETERQCFSGEGTIHWFEIGPYVSNDLQWTAASPPTADPPPTTGVQPPRPQPTTPSGQVQPPVVNEAPPPRPTISNFVVVAYTDAGHVGVSYDVGWQAGRDPVTCHFFIDGNEAFNAQCGTQSSKQFYGISPGQHSFYATVSDRYGIFGDPSPTLVRTVAAPQPPPPGPKATLAKGPTAPAGFRYAITLDYFPANADIAITCHDSVDPGGFYSFTLRTDGSGHAFTQSYCYSGDHPDHWFRANGVESNHVTW